MNFYVGFHWEHLFEFIFVNQWLGSLLKSESHITLKNFFNFSLYEFITIYLTNSLILDMPCFSHLYIGVHKLFSSLPLFLKFKLNFFQ